MDSKIKNKNYHAESEKQPVKKESKPLKDDSGLLVNDQFVSEGPKIKKIKDKISLVADTNVSILIQGETGTGKELIAQVIHDNSERRNENFVKVNCPAIPRELFESEFFGHIRGSFSGAVSDRVGRFQLADKGTLFLDEITEIPLDLQSKLLRVLQEGQFERVGESKTRFIDVRVISATNRDLKKEVEDGRFREDLFYRLNVFNLNIPPLRERLVDIDLIFDYYMDLFCEKYGIPIISPSPEDRNNLKNYTWPGNVRELKNMLERAVILCRKSPQNFSRVLDELLNSIESEYPQFTEPDKIVVTKESDLQDLNKENILKALNATNWKISGDRSAAKLLGVKENTLWKRINKLGLKKPK